MEIGASDAAGPDNTDEESSKVPSRKDDANSVYCTSLLSGWAVAPR